MGHGQILTLVKVSVSALWLVDFEPKNSWNIAL